MRAEPDRRWSLRILIMCVCLPTCGVWQTVSVCLQMISIVLWLQLLVCDVRAAGIVCPALCLQAARPQTPCDGVFKA